MNDGKLSREAVLRELRNHLPQFERLYGVTMLRKQATWILSMK